MKLLRKRKRERERDIYKNHTFQNYLFPFYMYAYIERVRFYRANFGTMELESMLVATKEEGEEEGTTFEDARATP